MLRFFLFFILHRDKNIKEREAKFKEIFGYSLKPKAKPFAKMTAKKIQLKPKSQDPVRRSPRLLSLTKHSHTIEHKTAKKSSKKAVTVDGLLESTCSDQSSQFQCSVCEKSFKFRNSLVKHKTSAHTDVVFSCDICRKNFALKESVLRHKRSHHSAVQPMFGCKICSSTFKYKHNLKAHFVQYHSNEQ